MRNCLILGFLFFATGFVSVFGANADTVVVRSEAMNKNVKVIVVKPDSVARFPVVYLLHGYDGNERQWLSVKPDLPQIAEEKGIIFVLPDGKNSWYLDSPLDSLSMYETFISVELISYIDKHYSTVADRQHRAITGLSMGGHGALFNAFRHKDVFGAVGSMSGAVDIRQRGKNFGLVTLLGSIETHRENWEQCSVLNRIADINSGELSIYIDCGREDFCFPLNEALHEALVKNGIDHEYTVRPGTHSYAYWRNSIDYHILFFHKYFYK
jgi:S-formylglutathione hydrolase FrmB